MWFSHFKAFISWYRQRAAILAFTHLVIISTLLMTIYQKSQFVIL